MPGRWLEERLHSLGDQPPPRFALPATMNWMRALAIHVGLEACSTPQLDAAYAQVARRKAHSPEAEARVCEALFLSAHHNSALSAMSSHEADGASLTRAAIISWYYALYTSARAMVIATSGQNPDKHARLIRAWHTDIAARNLAVGPFAHRLDSILKADVDAPVEQVRGESPGTLKVAPATVLQARGALAEYLSGTAEYERRRTDKHLRGDKRFKELGVSDFRSKSARELRAAAHRAGSVNFMTQAFRYRGKANYRDSLFLSYGTLEAVDFKPFLLDLSSSAAAFGRMAARYVARRLPTEAWKAFVEDVGKNSRMLVDQPRLGLVA